MPKTTNIQRANRDPFILAALRDGRPYKEIAAEFGITRTRVGQIAKQHGFPSLAVVKRTPAERVLARVVKTDADCWEWQGATSANGYGIIQLGRGLGTDRTHRVVYEAQIGPIPDGLVIDHLCHNILCCNPAHLEAVTRAENTRRQWADGRARPDLRRSPSDVEEVVDQGHRSDPPMDAVAS